MKIKRTYSLDKETVETIERLARKTRRDFSAIVEIAVEVYALELEREIERLAQKES